ncbi:MAG: ATP-binding protein [Anaerolineales bacterium]
MKRMKLNLSAQLVLGFVVLALLTTVAIGIPAIQLLDERLEQQAWAQVDQGARASKALLSATENDVQNLARLTAQRPTLLELLAESEQAALSEYLNTLRLTTGLDMILLCDNENRLLTMNEDFALFPQCEDIILPGYHVLTSTGNPDVMLTDTSVVYSGEHVIARVVVGMQMDTAFMARMKSQTDMEHLLWVNGVLAATNFRVVDERSEFNSPRQDDGIAQDGFRTSFSLMDKLYYATSYTIQQTQLEMEVALDVTDILTTRRQLVWSLIGIIFVIAAIGSTLGTILARGIGKSFQNLAAAAARISEGDLSTPVRFESHVREAALVAQTLEKARLDLNRTVTELRAEKAWGDHLLEAIVEGIVTLDSDNNITFFSSGAEKISGWSAGEVLDRQCDMFFKPIDHDQTFTELIPSPGQRRRFRVEMAANKTAMLAISGARLAPSEAHGAEVVFVFRDISEEDSVHRLMGHFMANISHEFRTPLTAVAASVELLLEEADDLSPGELQQLLNSLHLGLLSLQTLVDNLIESASIETGHFRVSPRAAELSNIIGEAVAIMRPLLEKYEQSLDVQLPPDLPLVRADPRRSTQVIVNLLSNANKYAPTGSHIDLRATEEGNHIKVEIADRGPGIPDKYRDGIFRRFAYLVQDDQASAQYGAGLGLSVVKAIVEAQSGATGVADNPEGGSIFWFTLPIQEAI